MRRLRRAPLADVFIRAARVQRGRDPLEFIRDAQRTSKPRIRQAARLALPASRHTDGLAKNALTQARRRAPRRAAAEGTLDAVVLGFLHGPGSASASAWPARP